MRKLVKFENWSGNVFDQVTNKLSLDELIEVDYEAEPVTLGDTLGTDDESRFIRLKMFLLSICKTKSEEKVIELLCAGFDYNDIAKKLNVSYKQIKNILYDVRKRCRKYGLGNNPKKKK